MTRDTVNEMQDLVRGTKSNIEKQIAEVQQFIGSATDSLQDSFEANQAQLRSCLKSLFHVRQIIDANHPQFILERNRAGQDSHAIFGTDAVQPQFDLTVA